MIDMETYLEQTNTVLLTREFYEELVKIATPKVGYWKHIGQTFVCSKCYVGIYEHPTMMLRLYKFCPYCGAQMEGQA